MKLKFTKMHGLGNDFVVLNAIDQDISLNMQQLRQLSDRSLGIGCDQILIVAPAQSNDHNFYYRIFNANGKEVGQCANGARCLMRFIHEQGLSTKKQITIRTQNRLLELTQSTNNMIELKMAAPVFTPKDIPCQAEAQQTAYTLETQYGSLRCYALSVGNPHAVLHVSDIHEAPVATIGEALEKHPFFPERANINFVEKVHRGQLIVRTFERGVGETFACGSGTCASMAALRQLNEVDETVDIKLRYGHLKVRWAGNDQPLYLAGPATTIFHGEILL
ncbi:diaminopimelate epimerase [Piscirickettsia salmonis]|uniref:diaminopimelate epimerase n=2 Tax=Piscirickettsia salmonis TaxID=1238 RepID=UPI000332D0AC|nr:diaminopimelate epimerase [Piscirickettsia salmonis]APS57718.1 diaminopimelate epimerase [Piscirickettsia salmonis]ERL62626.1 diaminopimelate epimerase [Piscirickettsia salmonis LF-89 = ATCC VR-1361]PEQ15532.1 diaminopimelate epimerase [Piscirickettsia salmonis]QGN76007.1 Diaminopimelate epimerase [Piscirickettsia salmonis]QGN79570.1 Diaminopimelate epimerase [Piscirickettsia salmonis]